MKYEASLDRFARSVTLGLFILFIILANLSVGAIVRSENEPAIIIYNVVAISIFFSFMAACFLFAAKSYRIDEKNLTIVRWFNSKKIVLSDISRVSEIPDREMDGVMRNFGMGGIFGYRGKYLLSKIGAVTLYGTQRKNGILIETIQGEKIVITPDDKRIIEKLKR